MQTILTYLHTRLQKYPYIALPGEPMQAYRMNARGQPPRPGPLKRENSSPSIVAPRHSCTHLPFNHYVSV